MHFNLFFTLFTFVQVPNILNQNLPDPLPLDPHDITEISNPTNSLLYLSSHDDAAAAFANLSTVISNSSSPNSSAASLSTFTVPVALAMNLTWMILIWIERKKMQFKSLSLTR